jgi:hypothetical protein
LNMEIIIKKIIRAMRLKLLLSYVLLILAKSHVYASNIIQGSPNVWNFHVSYYGGENFIPDASTSFHVT